MLQQCPTKKLVGAVLGDLVTMGEVLRTEELLAIIIF